MIFIKISKVKIIVKAIFKSDKTLFLVELGESKGFSIASNILETKIRAIIVYSNICEFVILQHNFLNLLSALKIYKDLSFCINDSRLVKTF